MRSRRSLPTIPTIEEVEENEDSATSADSARVAMDLKHIEPPRTDIDSCMRFSVWRLVFSIVSLVLVATDVPRTGLTIELSRLYECVQPGTWVYLGGAGFHVAKLFRVPNASNATPSVYTGTKNGKPIASTRLWSYKYDTGSISMRALAAQLDVRAYPAYVRSYDRADASSWTVTSLLSLETTFKMLDGLVDAIHQQPSRITTFCTTTIWKDRLHHVLGHWFWPVTHRRFHTLHHFVTTPAQANSTRSICERSRSRPYICDAGFRWYCRHPLVASKGNVSVWRHMDLRWQSLRQQNPSLHMDFTLITTRRMLVSGSSPSWHSVYYSSEHLEHVTLTRGRRCTPLGKCETVFIDDYRYERATISTNGESWRGVVRCLRGLSQAYIWLRLVLLWVGCYAARSRDLKAEASWGRQLLMVWRTFFLVPSHAVVYGSWPPVIGYTLAHLIDCGVMQLLTHNFWASTNGILANNRLVDHAFTASVQMRNLWLAAFVCKLILWTDMQCRGSRGLGAFGRWNPIDGVLGIRGAVLGSVSALTVFAFYRQLQFRNTAILDMTIFEENAMSTQAAIHPACVGPSEYGYTLDIKALLIAAVIALSGWLSLRCLVRLVTRRDTHFLLSRTHYVPLSAGPLWDPSMMNIFWYVGFKSRSRVAPDAYTTAWMEHPQRGTRSRQWHCPKWILALLEVSAPVAPSASARECHVCRSPSSIIHWRSVQGCVVHEPIFNVNKRCLHFASLVRVINIVMMTDPLVWVALRLTGRPLFIFRRRQRRNSLTISSEQQPIQVSGATDPNVESTPPPPVRLERRRSSLNRLPLDLLVLPVTHATIAALQGVSDKSGSLEGLEFMDVVSSAHVTWHLLVGSG
ncbi:hypothetical protein PINS_up008121 [Pythium insidiosum]|nr:hypothetical protein PINS_up008121 [Pythium insidiosum]